MLYKFPRKDIQILAGYDFSRKYFDGEIGLQAFLDWFDGFKSELEQKQIQNASIEAFRNLATRNPKNILFLEFFDGTKNTRNGQILGSVLAELSRYQEILVYPPPGEADEYGRNFTVEALKHCYEGDRKQVNLTRLSNLLVDNGLIRNNPYSNKLFLFEYDIYTPDRTNWCYGIVQPISTPTEAGEIDCHLIYFSAARIKNTAQLHDLFAHELGHMLNAAHPGRSNTIESLGSHCTNELCVMQQKLESGQALQYALLRHKNKAPTFCSQCQEDIKRHKPNFALKDLLKVNFAENIPKQPAQDSQQEAAAKNIFSYIKKPGFLISAAGLIIILSAWFIWYYIQNVKK